MVMHMDSGRAQGKGGGLWPWSRRRARPDEREYLSYGPLYDELLHLKYLHQRYTNYLAWLGNRG